MVFVYFSTKASVLSASYSGCSNRKEKNGYCIGFVYCKIIDLGQIIFLRTILILKRALLSKKMVLFLKLFQMCRINTVSL